MVCANEMLWYARSVCWVVESKLYILRLRLLKISTPNIIISSMITVSIAIKIDYKNAFDQDYIMTKTTITMTKILLVQ